MQIRKCADVQMGPGGSKRPFLMADPNHRRRCEPCNTEFHLGEFYFGQLGPINNRDGNTQLLLGHFKNSRTRIFLYRSFDSRSGDCHGPRKIL